MSDELDLENLDLEQEEDDEFVTLIDEDGKEVRFAFLGIVSYEEDDYVILLPEDDLESGEVLILKIEVDAQDNESYVTIEDPDTQDIVYEIFRNQYQDDYDFEE